MKPLLPPLNIRVEPNEAPPSACVIEACRDSVEKLQLTVSGTATSALGLCFVSFLAHTFTAAYWAGAVFIISLVTFALLHRWENGSLKQRMSELQPIPDELCAEAAALCELSEPARQYGLAVREQKRELTRAELEALRRAVRTQVPATEGRQAMYG